jgi:hypothetical protein
MSGANGGLNEKFVHGRSLLREVDAANNRKVRARRAREFGADQHRAEHLCIGALKWVTCL